MNIPVIMIGCGTGVAPFRGFLQNRSALKNSSDSKIGEMALFFGCRHKNSDFIFEDEFNKFLNDGILTYLFTAFSRDSVSLFTLLRLKNIILLKKLRKTGWLFGNFYKKAHIFMFAGIYFNKSASKISSGIKESINYVLKNFGGLDDERVKNYIKNLNRQNRYCIDVW